MSLLTGAWYSVVSMTSGEKALVLKAELFLFPDPVSAVPLIAFLAAAVCGQPTNTRCKLHALACKRQSRQDTLTQLGYVPPYHHNESAAGEHNKPGECS